MSGNNLDSNAIYIKGSASSNGLTTLLVGTIVALIGTVIIVALPKLLFLVGILFLSGSIIAFVMGFYKLREPKYSLEITKEAIVYHHRKGKWRIEWENIQRVDVPRVHKGLEHIDLEMVGFRLRDPERFLNNISLRLITHLLMEQRPLVTQIAMSDCASGQCYGDDIIDDVKYKCEDGGMITGVSAMFANRMRKLQKGIGYDVYLSVNELDRDGTSFVALLRECQDSLPVSQSDSSSIET
ncbi:MAG: hypothetical protein ACJAVV_003133 [Alphaproteobacteria bacterium]|jgi:hypothetical protein